MLTSRPDPEVVAKPKRRTYTAEYKQRILAEAEAAVAVALLLGAIEVIQIHLPGRVAEITDPLLALLLAVILGLSDRWQSLRSDSLAR